MKFVHVATRTSDLDRALAFYEILGLRLIEKTELQKGKATLAFVEPPEGGFRHRARLQLGQGRCLRWR